MEDRPADHKNDQRNASPSLVDKEKEVQIQCEFCCGILGSKSGKTNHQNKCRKRIFAANSQEKNEAAILTSQTVNLLTSLETQRKEEKTKKATYKMNSPSI